MKTTAFAIKEGGEIKVNTIHAHDRGAMVNWLATNGWLVPARTTDEMIREAFRHFQVARAGQDNSIEVVAVSILEEAA